MLRSGGDLKGSGSGNEVSSSSSFSGSIGAEGRNSSGSKPNLTLDGDADLGGVVDKWVIGFASDRLGDNGGVMGGFGAFFVDGTDKPSFAVFILGISS